jgi:Na+/melibiose symporter-like transporter
MPPSSDRAHPQSGQPSTDASAEVFRTGTLTYNRKGLTRLFTWLMAGDVVFVLISQIEPRVLPVLLKLHGATDSQITFIVSSIPAILTLLINPVVSYCSDRTKTSRGRRIPYLLWATPFVSLLLAITPFAPQIANALGDSSMVKYLTGLTGASSVVLMFGIFVLLYQIFQNVVSAVFFYLLRDVVPTTHMGRFMSLFRIVGALSTFILIYWLLSAVEKHSHTIFISVAVLNLIGFTLMCFRVKEGEYPEVTDKVERKGWRLGHAARNYIAECFSQPIYWWMYGARICVYVASLLIGFLIFFPQIELGMGLETAARYTAIPSLAWLLVAYPVGILLDRWGVMRVFELTLWLNVSAYIASFFLVTGPVSFFISALVTGILFWLAMLSQMVYLQQLVHPQRVGQLSSANAALQSVIIIALVSPVAGRYLDFLKGYEAIMTVPLIGDVSVGPYRFVNLMLALLFLVSLFCLHRSRRHWLRLGGPKNYQAPL